MAGDTGGGIFGTASAVINLESGASINNNAANGRYAGGVYLSGTSILNVADGASVNNNSAAQVGGGIYAIDTTTVNLRGTLADNSSAIHAGGGYIAGGTFNFYASGRVTGNTATSQGGGLYIENSSLTISGRITSNRSGSHGGGVYAQNSSVTLAAGGVLGELNGGNVASGNGGGVALVSGGSLTLHSSVLYNQGDNGGGIYSTGPVLVSAGVGIANNTSSRNGGGLFLDGAGSSLTLPAGAEIRSNSAGSTSVGGGLYATAGTVVINGVIAGNTAGNGGGLYAANSAKVTLGPAGVCGPTECAQPGFWLWVWQWGWPNAAYSHDPDLRHG